VKISNCSEARKFTLGRKNPIAEATKGEAVKCEQHMKLFHYTQAGLFLGTRIKKKTLYA
jgi:hypothetical protein